MQWRRKGFAHSNANLVWHHPWKLSFHSQDDLCECLLDTTSNGIYQAVHWVAEHYKSGTPITLLNRPIPKLKNAKSWKVWKKRLLYYYKRPSLYDSSLFLYCATKDFWDGGRFWYFPQFLSHLNGNPEDFHIQILKRQQCTVSRKTNPNASSEIPQNKYKINSRPTRSSSVWRNRIIHYHLPQYDFHKNVVLRHWQHCPLFVLAKRFTI